MELGRDSLIQLSFCMDDWLTDLLWFKGVLSRLFYLLRFFIQALELFCLFLNFFGIFFYKYFIVIKNWKELPSLDFFLYAKNAYSIP